MLLASTQLSAYPTLIPFRCGNTWGYADSTKKIVIPCRFQEAKPFFNGLAAVKWNNKWGYILPDGNIVIENLYDTAYDFSKSNKAIVYINNKAGIIRKDGTEVLPFEYTSSSNKFGEGFFIMRKGFYSYLIGDNYDLDGESLECRPIDVFSEGLAPVITNVEQKVIDPLKGRLSSSEARGLTFIDTLGNFKTPLLDYLCYKYVSGFSEGFAIIRFESLADGSTSFLYHDKLGNLLPYQYDLATPFYKGNAVVKAKKGNFGIINNQFEWIKTIPFETNTGIKEGLIAVKDASGKWGYIDLNLNIIIPFQYDAAEMFNNGIAKVIYQGKVGYINTAGIEFWTN